MSDCFGLCCCFHSVNETNVYSAHQEVLPHSLNDAQFIRTSENVPYCLVCTKPILSKNDFLLECLTCNRYIGHYKCVSEFKYCLWCTRDVKETLLKK